MSDTLEKEVILDHTVELVSAHISNNPVPAGDLPALIRDVYEALQGLDTPAVEEEPVPEPAVPVKKSVHPDYIVCLEDGAKLKMLKRYIKTRFDMTPDEYRHRWGLPSDYPMVAPNYAAKRSSLAKQIGLGRKAKQD